MISNSSCFLCALQFAQFVPLSVLVSVDSARMLTQFDDSSSSVISRLKTFAHQQIHISMKNFTWWRSCADPWNAWVNMTSLYNFSLDGAYDGQQRSLEDFQFDLQNVLTMSQLVGKLAEDRIASSVMLDILSSTKTLAGPSGAYPQEVRLRPEHAGRLVVGWNASDHQGSLYCMEPRLGAQEQRGDDTTNALLGTNSGKNDGGVHLWS